MKWMNKKGEIVKHPCNPTDDPFRNYILLTMCSDFDDIDEMNDYKVVETWYHDRSIDRWVLIPIPGAEYKQVTYWEVDGVRYANREDALNAIPEFAAIMASAHDEHGEDDA